MAVAADIEDAEAEEAVGEIRLVIQSTRASIITVAGFMDEYMNGTFRFGANPTLGESVNCANSEKCSRFHPSNKWPKRR